MAFSKVDSSLIETIKNVDSQISITNDNLIPNVDRRRIWKYLKQKEEEERQREEENNSDVEGNDEEQDNNPGLENADPDDQNQGDEGNQNNE